MSLRNDILAYQQGKLSPLEILERIRASDTSTPSSFGLSEEQRGLLALQRLRPESAVHNVPWCFRVRETLDLPAFERAARILFERVPIFRARFVDEDGEARHRIHPAPDMVVTFGDAAGLDDEDVRAVLIGIAERPFALDREPPLRIHLLSRSGDEHFLLLLAHHIVVDGHSLPLITSHLWDAYDRMVRGEAMPAGAPDTGFEDFVAWQRAWLEGAAAGADLEYWRKVLEPPLPVLRLGDGEEAGRVPEKGRGRIRSLVLPPALAAAIRAVAQAQRVTPSVLFLAAYRVLLSRYSGEADIIIGTATMNRPQRRFERAIGFFVNMIALRSPISGDQDLVSLLKAEQCVLAEAIDHGHYPFARLVRDLRIARSSTASPIYQVAFGYIGAALMDWDAADFAGLSRHEIEPFPGIFQDADCELLLEVQEESAGFTVTAKYDGTHFDDLSIAKMLDAYGHTLSAMVADPLASVDSLALPGGPERRPWHELAAPAAGQRPKPDCVHHLFEVAAQRDPDAVAVASNGAELGYGELNARANRLARHLREMGVEPDARVALCCEANAAFLIGALAILKAGGAYVPLDPAYPRERLRYMLEDSAPVALLHAGKGAWAAPQGMPSIDIEADAHRWADASAEDLPPAAGPRDLAYVIYTSGSTGEPKGVMIEHRNLLHTLDAVRQAYAISSADRVLQFVSPSFDVSALEVFTALTAGATLVQRDDRWIESPERFRALCQTHGVTIAHMPASLWHRFLVEDGATAPESLRLVVIGGEQADRDWLARWRDRNGNAPRLLNQYGPTEATIVATMADLSGADAISIGQPLDGVRIELLDAQGGPVGPGEVGELCIGGGGVGRGYLNRPELTAERFVLDHADAPGARLYRTGDRARWSAAGMLEFHGRVDRQVKLRGIRIELDEIEAQLARHPAVKEVAVLVWGEDPATQRLVAYLTPHGDVPLSAELVRDHARSVLPDALVPAVCVMLEVMPLGPNGKLDRNALPPPADTDGADGEVAPRTPLEEALVSIFADILKVNRIGITDNFFERGGDSLAAAQAIAHIRQLLDIEIPVPLLFEAQTVAVLAEEIVAQVGEAGFAGAVPAAVLGSTARDQKS